MLIFTQILSTAPGSGCLGHVLLDHDQRRRGRLRAELDDGTAVGLAMPSGTVLRDGTVISTPLGEWCAVKAKSEPISIASSNEPFLLTRAVYHLGNRHVALELKPAGVAYLADSSIDQLCVDLGLSVTRQWGAFEPEKLGKQGHDHAHALASGNSPVPSPMPSALHEGKNEPL